MSSFDSAGPPSFDRAYVISDLHLGGDTGFQMFSASSQFQVLIPHVLAELGHLRATVPDARALLVINGDFVDFLAEPDAKVFNPNRAADMLGQILDRQEFARVVSKLREFVEADGTQLVITLGNHDLELALPAARRALLHRLTNGRGNLEGKVELCFDGWGYRFRVNGKQALCVHGNETDVNNFTRYDELDRIVHDVQILGRSDLGDEWEPSAGSWFVINAVNRIKRDYAFIDLLKPEVPLAGTMLVLLDPTKLKYAERLAGLGVRATDNEDRRPDVQRRMLSSGALLETNTQFRPAAAHRVSKKLSVACSRLWPASRSMISSTCPTTRGC